MNDRDRDRDRAVDVLHLVVPACIDDPGRPSGGNVYDRELSRSLRARGRRVREHVAASAWPQPGQPVGRCGDPGLTEVLAAVPDGATTVIDGLVGLGAAEVLEVEQDRLRLWLLVHLPLALAFPDATDVRARELQALNAVVGSITTSDWTRGWLVSGYGVDPGRVRVARPGVHPAPVAPGTSSGGELLCVGPVMPPKGQDVLVAALTGLRDVPWSCRVVGALDQDPLFVERLRDEVRGTGLEDRVRFTGPGSRADLAAAYAASDLLVQPTRLETYGMAVTEALAHGLPVVAGDTGGVREALGGGSGPGIPGMLVTPGDVDSLVPALRSWLTDEAVRHRLRLAAATRRLGLSDWSATAGCVDEAVFGVTVNRSRLGSVMWA